MSDIKELVDALVKAQTEMTGARKESTNPHFRSKYADLEAVTDAIKPIANKHGLFYLQKFHECPDGVAIETIIYHSSGTSISNGILRVPASKQDAQGYGSAITYARRYSLKAAFGLADEDDDGNSASQPVIQKPTPPKPAPPKQEKELTFEEIITWADKHFKFNEHGSNAVDDILFDNGYTRATLGKATEEHKEIIKADIKKKYEMENKKK